MSQVVNEVPPLGRNQLAAPPFTAVRYDQLARPASGEVRRSARLPAGRVRLHTAPAAPRRGGLPGAVRGPPGLPGWPPDRWRQRRTPQAYRRIYELLRVSAGRPDRVRHLESSSDAPGLVPGATGTFSGAWRGR